MKVIGELIYHLTRSMTKLAREGAQLMSYFAGELSTFQVAEVSYAEIFDVYVHEVLDRRVVEQLGNIVNSGAFLYIERDVEDVILPRFKVVIVYMRVSWT